MGKPRNGCGWGACEDVRGVWQARSSCRGFLLGLSARSACRAGGASAVWRRTDAASRDPGHRTYARSGAPRRPSRSPLRCRPHAARGRGPSRRHRRPRLLRPATPDPALIDRDKVPAMAAVRDGRGFFEPCRSRQRYRSLFQRVPERVHHRPRGQSASARSSSYRGFVALAAARHAAGDRGLHERHPPQRSLRRHRELGLDPDRDQPRRPPPTIRSSASTRSAARSTSR